LQNLKNISLFKDSTDIDLGAFDRRCQWKRFDDGHVVVDYEDASTDVYFILSGKVRVLIRTRSGKEIILADLVAGQMFGELAAVDRIERSANVTVLNRAELCIMPAAVFSEIVYASPIVCDAVLRLFAGRIRDLNARLMENTVFTLKHRLYAELLRLSVVRSGHKDQRILSPPPFQHVLAARIGCRREQISRELTQLAEEGLLQKNRGGIVLLQPEVLKRRIKDAMSDG
jgi:CRP/FNR family cyclic AMP-dependent transcriptional regulator